MSLRDGKTVFFKKASCRWQEYCTSRCIINGGTFVPEVKYEFKRYEDSEGYCASLKMICLSFSN